MESETTQLYLASACPGMGGLLPPAAERAPPQPQTPRLLALGGLGRGGRGAEELQRSGAVRVSVWGGDGPLAGVTP